MSSESFDVDFSVRVRVTIGDEYDVIERVTGPDGDDWRAHLYDLHTEEDVLAHLAYNCAANGAQNASMLDGWADLPDDAVQMEILEADYVEWHGVDDEDQR